MTIFVHTYTGDYNTYVRGISRFNTLGYNNTGFSLIYLDTDQNGMLDDEIVSMRCNEYNCILLDIRGNVLTWGEEVYLGREKTQKYVPTIVFNDAQYIGGMEHNLFYGFGNEMYVWGNNTYKQVSGSDIMFYEYPWKRVIGVDGKSEFGSYHSCAAVSFVVFLEGYFQCNGVSEKYSRYVCSKRGNCSKEKCTCLDDYIGNDCQYNICYNISGGEKEKVCSGKGKCIEKDFCLCYYPDKWGGRECDLPKCNYVLAVDSNVCSGRGDCLLNNETLEYECVCDNKMKWKGKDCSKKIISEFEYTRKGLVFVTLGVACVIGGVIVFLLFFIQKIIDRYCLDQNIEEDTFKKIKSIEMKEVKEEEKEEEKEKEEEPKFKLVNKLDSEIQELEKILRIEEEGGDALEIEMKEELGILDEIDSILKEENNNLPQKDEVIEEKKDEKEV